MDLNLFEVDKLYKEVGAATIVMDGKPYMMFNENLFNQKAYEKLSAVGKQVYVNSMPGK